MNRDSNPEKENPYATAGEAKPVRSNTQKPLKKSKNTEDHSSGGIRILIGVIAGIMLAAGAFLYLANPDTDPFVLGLLIRVGSLLAVICLAFPELMSLRGRMSAVLYGLALILIIVIAVRPKLSRVLVTLAIIGLGVGWVMRWITKVTKQ